jgi:outer membrane protein TolC
VFVLRAGLFALLFAWPIVLGAAPAFIDLPTAMELAGANNDEIKLAKLKHDESLTAERLAWQRFWPSFSLGAGFRGHDGRVQDIAGLVFDASKRQYSLGTEILLDWSPGNLYFSALAARQSAVAAEHLAESTRRETVLEAIRRYYALLATEADSAILEEDLRLTQDYARQLEGAVSAGTAFRTDLLRVQTEISRQKRKLREASEARDLAAAALAQSLRLPPESELRAAKADLIPVPLIPPSDSSSQVAEATRNRPEIKAATAAQEAADLEKDRARLAPVIPDLRTGYTFGGLAGGITGNPGNLGDSQDYFVGLGWKIGPGGLFDKQSQKLAETRRQTAELQTDQVRAAIGREVVEASARSRSAYDRILINEEAVAAAGQMVDLAKERQASQIGVVLEYLLAREELTKARQDRVLSVTDFNTAQHELRVALGR